MKNLSSQDERIDQVAGVFQRALCQRCRSQQKILRHVFSKQYIDRFAKLCTTRHIIGKRKETTFIGMNEKYTSTGSRI